MLENFIVSVGIVVPIFLIMLLGYVLRRKNITTEGFVQNGNFLVFKIALPTTLFHNVYSQNVHDLMDVSFIAFTVTATLACFGLSWLFAKVFVKDKTLIAAFVHSAFRGNFMILGFPVMMSWLGADNVGKAALVILFTIPLYNILAIIVLSVYSSTGKKISITNILKTIVTNPLTIGIILGLILSLMNITMPDILDSTVGYISSLTTPLALICLGGGLELSKYNPKIKFGVWAATMKVLVQPVIVVAIAYFLGFRSYDLAIILITFSVPAAITSYTMTVQMGGDHYVGATSVMFSTFFSVFTLTGFIYAFMMMGWV